MGFSRVEATADDNVLGEDADGRRWVDFGAGLNCCLKVLKRVT